MKKYVQASLHGALMGVAMEFIVAILISLTLHLGYLLPYPASIPERVGGEMNAVLIQTALCALAGGGSSVLWLYLKRNPRQKPNRAFLCAKVPPNRTQMISADRRGGYIV